MGQSQKGIRYEGQVLDRGQGRDNREKIAITRHGVHAALLFPVGPAEHKLSHKEIVEGMRDLRKRVKPGKMIVSDMVNEGRRFRPAL